MMGRLKSEQGQLFYQFNLEDAVPVDHLVRRIDAALDLSWLRDELAPHYSSMGRPSIDPELMIRMLVVGYQFTLGFFVCGVEFPKPVPLARTCALWSSDSQFGPKRDTRLLFGKQSLVRGNFDQFACCFFRSDVSIHASIS
jgi:hypothetical protein